MKAFILMGILTTVVAAILYTLGAHLHYREFVWAIAISIVLLATHMANLAIYFSVAGKKPYKWFD